MNPFLSRLFQTLCSTDYFAKIFQSLLELRTALDAKIVALEAVVMPAVQERDNERSVSDEGEEEEGESQMDKRISQNA